MGCCLPLPAEAPSLSRLFRSFFIISSKQCCVYHIDILRIFYQNNHKGDYAYPVDTGHLLNVLCTFNLRPVSTALKEF